MKYLLPPLLVFTFCAFASASENWPRFRGPDARGSTDSKGLPLKWSETENVKWKTPVHGRAWSSPVILDRQIWMTTASEDGKELGIVCVDKDSGQIVRDAKLFDVAEPQFAHAFNSYASPTPVIEPGRLYATWGSPATACIDTQTGKVLWERRDLECNHFRGAGSSPVIWGDLLINNFDGSDHQFVIALDKKSGKTVWRTERSIDYQDLENGKPKGDGDFRKGFSSPVIIDWQGKPLLISSGSKACYAYEPATGREIWRYENRRAHSTSMTPLAGFGMVFVATGLPKGELVALKLGGQGLLTEKDVVWTVSQGTPAKPSPVLVGDLLFVINDSGIASCLEAKTGAEVWRERVGGAYSASPLYAEGHVYLFAEDGKATVLDAGRTFKVLAENKLEDGFMASPAVSGKALYLRTKTHLYRIEK
jgi:outer membrane protein assembly factor BamB